MPFEWYRWLLMDSMWASDAWYIWLMLLVPIYFMVLSLAFIMFMASRNLWLTWFVLGLSLIFILFTCVLLFFCAKVLYSTLILDFINLYIFVPRADDTWYQLVSEDLFSALV